MSWSTRITSAPDVLRDLLDHLPELLRLLVREPRGRLVQQHDPGLADDGPRELDEAPRTGARAHRPSRSAEAVEPDEGERAHDVVVAGRACASRVLVDHARRSRTRTAASIACSVWNVRRRPQRARRKSAMRSRSSPNARTDPDAGATNPLRTLKNVVLPAPFGPIRPQVPSRERHGHVVERRDAAEADGQPVDLDHGGPCVRGVSPERLRDQRGRGSSCLGELRHDALRRRHEHLQDADAEEDEQEVRVPRKKSNQSFSSAGNSCCRTPATTAPHRLKIPPISTTASSDDRVDRLRRTGSCTASRRPRRADRLRRRS